MSEFTVPSTTQDVAQLSQMDRSSVWDKEDGEHPLQSAWAFWYDKKASYRLQDSSEFRGRLVKLGSFDTIESFWKLYLYIKRPSAVELNVNLYLFRDGEQHAPMWECYPRGGCWILKVKKRKDSGASVLGKIWQDMVFGVIGEAFEEPDVVGVSVCIRRNEDLISVWNADNRNDEIRFKIGEKMKQILDLEPTTIIEYKHHFASMNDMSTFRNAKAYVFATNDSAEAAEPEPTV
jgi:translation initiation factor 4E